jgi:hypothetical protein
MTPLHRFLKQRFGTLIRQFQNRPQQLEMTWPGLPAPMVPDLPDGHFARLYKLQSVQYGSTDQ